jgi:hypothetical protein
MGPDRDRDSLRSDRLSRRDEQALAVLERSAKPGLGKLWRRFAFQLLLVWGVRLAIWAGLIACLAALLTMWDTMGTHIAVALGAEMVLTAGALLCAHGLRLWWAWREFRRGQRAAER